MEVVAGVACIHSKKVEDMTTGEGVGMDKMAALDMDKVDWTWDSKQFRLLEEVCWCCSRMF